MNKLKLLMKTSKDTWHVVNKTEYHTEVRKPTTTYGSM